MAEDDQGNHSHRFAGGHATLARAIKSEEQEAAITSMVKDKIRLYLEISPQGMDSAKPLQIDAILVNNGVGHRFPGGARDLRDTWVEIEFLDSERRTLASSGHRYRQDPSERDVHRLRVGLVDERGELVETHGVGHFRTPAFDHTIAPQGAAIARYALPREAAKRVDTVRARLLQRRLTPVFQAYACAENRREAGQRFKQATKRFTGLSVDACAEQPILTLAEETLEILGVKRVPDWEATYWHGVGLTGDLQERARYAIAKLHRALDLIPTGRKRPEVMVRTELARALLRAGRSVEALNELQKAEALLPDEPVIHSLRAQAYRQTWRFEEMISPLKRALSLAPNDAGLARELALAYGSLRKHRLALQAAQHGLKLEPRDVDLLRLQMLAYQELDRESVHHRSAQRVFLAHKRDEEASTIRIACSRASAECLKEQLPIPIRTVNLKNLDKMKD